MLNDRSNSYVYKSVNRSINITSIIMGIDEDRDKDFIFSGESHNFWEIVFVSKGEITATADEKIYNLKQGMLLFHKPMEFHRLIANRKDSSHLKIISFTAKGELTNHFKNRCFNLGFAEQDAFSEIADFFLRAYVSYRHAPKDYNYLSNMAATLLEVFLLKLKLKKDLKSKPLSYNEDLYYRIVKTMKENCDKSLSVNDIANMLNVSASNMKRVFALYSDIGIAKYFLNLKIRRAKELLNEGLSPSSVAVSLSFRPNYFYTVFKREVGVTPYKYSQSSF